jgi:hypothetical protein
MFANLKARLCLVQLNQSLVGLVVIDAQLGREDHGSILRNCNREGLKPLDVRTDPEPINQIKLGLKKKAHH